jgi:hypothetical protein
LQLPLSSGSGANGDCPLANGSSSLQSSSPYRQLAIEAQRGGLSPPLSAFPGWATCTFAIARRERVAYLYMPKAGSTSLRILMEQSYRLRPAWRLPGGIERDDTFVALPSVAMPRKWMLDFYPGRFIEEPHSGRLVSNQSVAGIDCYYKFSFVVDPLDHLIAGFCEVSSWTKQPEHQCASALRDGNISEPLRLLFDSEVSRLHRLLTRNEGALARLYRAVVGGAKQAIDVHYAPQHWLLRAAAACGQRLDFVAKLSPKSWEALRQDMTARGYTPPRPLPKGKRNGKSFSSLTAMFLRAASAETVRMACASVAGEYAALRLPPRRDGLCATAGEGRP